MPTYNYWNEALHGVARAGVATMFPQAIGMAAAFDEDAMQKVGDMIAQKEEQNTMNIPNIMTEIFTKG